MKLKLGLIISIAVLSAYSFAGDIKRGQKLHDGSCVSCHQAKLGGDGTGMYTRENRRVGSYAGLTQQVNRCTANIGASWKEDQINDVITYLNQSFYKFKKDKK